MRCIFCLHDRLGTAEHVFPLAIGGCLVTDRVCKPCNDTLGSRVDAALANHLLIQIRRAELGLGGNSGTPAPALHKPLLGAWPLADDPEQKVHVTYNEQTGKLDTRTLPRSIPVVLPDGTAARQVSLDPSDLHLLPKILQRERKRQGLPALSAEALEAECRKLAAPENIRTTENPTLHMTLTFDARRIPQALLKIVYELAFLWIGEDYLDDPKAAIIRAAIFADDTAPAEEVLQYTGAPAEWPAIKYWQIHRAHHLAFATTVAAGVGVCVRVFDLFGGSAVVTDDAARYLSGPDPGSKLRFLVMDARDQRQHESTLRAEQQRLAHEHVMMQRVSAGENDSTAGWDWRQPLPDPLGPD